MKGRRDIVEELKVILGCEEEEVIDIALSQTYYLAKVLEEGNHIQVVGDENMLKGIIFGVPIALT